MWLLVVYLGLREYSTCCKIEGSAYQAKITIKHLENTPFSMSFHNHLLHCRAASRQIRQSSDQCTNHPSESKMTRDTFQRLQQRMANTSTDHSYFCYEWEGMMVLKEAHCPLVAAVIHDGSPGNLAGSCSSLVSTSIPDLALLDWSLWQNIFTSPGHDAVVQLISILASFLTTTQNLHLFIFMIFMVCLVEVNQWYTVCLRSWVNLYFHRKAILALWPFPFDISDDLSLDINVCHCKWYSILVISVVFLFSCHLPDHVLSPWRCSFAAKIMY